MELTEALNIARSVIESRREKWPEDWKKAISAELILEGLKPSHEKLQSATKEQIERAVNALVFLEVEMTLSMQEVILCRTGKHPTCIDGQPYDPRYQQPNTLPKKEIAS